MTRDTISKIILAAMGLSLVWILCLTAWVAVLHIRADSSRDIVVKHTILLEGKDYSLNAEYTIADVYTVNRWVRDMKRLAWHMFPKMMK